MSIKKIESLNKHENPATNTNPFNIDAYLNDNWDKVKEVVDNNADELTVAQQDITDIKAKNTEQDSRIETNESKITELQSDNEINKTNISNLQSDNTTNKSNIQVLQADNTTNKQNILDIKQEQTTQNANIEQNKSDIANINEEIATINEKDTAQDTHIETLTQRLTEKENQIAELEDKVSDLNNNQIYGQASGEYVHLSDSAKMECDIGILGNSRQETRQGYNKLPYPYSESTVTKKGVTFTVNEDGTIKVNGTPTEDAYFYLYQGKISDFKSIAELNGKKAKITQVPTGSSSTYYLSMYNFDNSGTSVYTQGGDSSYVTVDNQEQSVNIALCVKSGYVANNLVISPMILLEGETATAYEQYGAMPSLYYPSEIESVSNANVKVCNKNLSKIDKISTINGGYINASCGIIGEIKSGKTYVISFNCSSKHTGTNVINLRTSTDSGYEIQTNLNYSSGKRISKTFTAKNNGELSLSASFGTDYTDVLYDVQLEEDTETDYVEHEEQNYPVDMQEEMLEGDYFDLENEEEVHNWNETVLNGTENWVIAATLTNTIQYKLDVSGLNITSRNAKSENILVEQTYGDREQLVIGGNLTDLFINFSKSRATTLEEFKALLNTNNIKLHYMSEPRKLDLTENQKAQLQALQKAKTYKNITNITTDTIAVLDVDYKRDLETIINNMQAQILAE